MQRVVRWVGHWLGPWRPGSGPLVARLFHCALALVLLAAWVSLGVQVEALIGSRGLLPIQASLRAASADEALGFFDLPTLFWLSASDFMLGLGVLIGAVLAAFALLGAWPRVSFGLSAALYLSYAVAGDAFTAFQWDNMLVETRVPAALLPLDRARPLVHFMLRVLLFKLYFESGIAKWQSHLGDWHDGSAMTFYFETAPLPTWLAWYAHQLPKGLLHALSRLTLVVELVVPWLVFGPRRLRTTAFVLLTGFQLINTVTANYGFFTYLSLTLHVFLLDDAQLGSIARRLPRWALTDPAISSLRPPAFDDGVDHAWFSALAMGYVTLSLIGAVVSFSPSALGPGVLRQAYAVVTPFRVVNVYHLFAHITRQRIEPTFEARVGDRWIELELPYKAGDPTRAPGFVAPHQPRLDFRLWFYGLSARSGAPEYVRTLVERLCRDPDAVQRLFATRLPSHPEAVRIAFHQYHFTDSAERARDGAWWKRQELGSWGPVPCINAP